VPYIDVLQTLCVLLCHLQYPKLLDVPLTGEAGGSVIMLDLLFELGMDRRLIAKMILAQPAIMEAKVKRVKALVLYLERVSSTCIHCIQANTYMI
jgi:hypothetical protein